MKVTELTMRVSFAGWLIFAGVGSAQTAETHPTVRCAGTSPGTPTAWIYVRPGENRPTACGATWGDACSDVEAGLAACANKKPCALLVAPGIYKLKHSASLPDGVHLYGGCMPAGEVTQGSRSLLIAPDGGFPALLVDHTTLPYTGIDGFYLMGTNAQNHVERRLVGQVIRLMKERESRMQAMPHTAGFAPPPPADSIQDPKTGKWYAKAQPSGVLYARNSTFSLRNVRVVAGNGGSGADGLRGTDGEDNSLEQFLAQRPTAEANFVTIMSCGHNALQQQIPLGDLLLHADDWNEMVTPWSPHESPSGGTGMTPAKSWAGGAGGGGGFEGGASFGLLLFGSNVKLDHVEIVGGQGGNGGNGGDGGHSLYAGLQPGRFPLNEPGAGGGGAGGWPGPRIAVLYDSSTNLNEVTPAQYATDFLLSQFVKPSRGGQQGRQRDAECAPEPPAVPGPKSTINTTDQLKLSVAAPQARNLLAGSPD